jgi:hypothetical protein
MSARVDSTRANHAADNNSDAITDRSLGQPSLQPPLPPPLPHYPITPYPTPEPRAAAQTSTTYVCNVATPALP